MLAPRGVIASSAQRRLRRTRPSRPVPQGSRSTQAGATPGSSCGTIFSRSSCWTRPISSSKERLRATPFNPGCWQLVPTSGVVLDIAPSDALRPFLPVARFTTKVDGAIWARSDYGSTKFAQAADYNGYGVPGFAPRIDDIELSCTPARHKLSISVEIAGATENPPPVELDVEVPCVTVGAEPLDDAGAPSIDATGGAIVVDSSPTNDSANAPATDPSAVETHVQLGDPQVQSEGGCSIARNAGAGLWPAVSLLAGVASLQRTRRRKRRRQLPSTARSTWILVVGVGASIGAGCAADSAHVGPSENVVDQGNDASTDVVATDEAEADQLDEAEADQLDASLCDGGRWVYLQAGCGPSTPSPTCWIGTSEACATLFCWCDKTSSFGGCGPGAERPLLRSELVGMGKARATRARTDGCPSPAHGVSSSPLR
jgi:hypothetical protein